MAARESGKSRRIKPYSLAVKTYSSTGILSRKNIVLSANRPPLPQKRSAPVSSRYSQNFEEEDDINVGSDDPIDDGYDHSVSSYEKRRRREADRWESLQDDLVNTYIEGSAMKPSQCCVKCSEGGQSDVLATMRCSDCGPNQFFCSDCAESLHRTRNLFHIVEVWRNDEMFVPLMLGNVLEDPHHVKCPTTETRLITCVDQRGCQHLKQIQFCKCKTDAATLVRLNLWPGSPAKPKVAFHFNLMHLAETFLLESHVSLHKFCASIEIQYPTMLPKLIKNIYAILNSGSFDEFRYFKHNIRSLDVISSGLVDYTKCALCPQDGESGVIIHSMDACFGLTRKKNAGNSFTTPNHGCLLFADQDEVDNFVDNYSNSKKQKAEESCQTFKAGEVTEALRSKGKNSLFDEKGVFGSCCSRHTHPGKFFSIKHGERISYSIFELQRLLQACERNPDIDLKIMYDIGCVLSSHLKANGQQETLSNLTISIPIFHCYGHKASCQVEFSPRRLEGFGLTDGEAIERLWSYLRGFSSITKEMSASRRIDLLTDALLHLSRKNFENAGHLLKTKLKRCKEVKGKTQAQLQETFGQLSFPYSCDIVDNWADREKEIILTKQQGKKQYKESWQEKYVRNILHFKQLRSVAACGSYEKGDEPITEESSVHEITKKLYSVDKSLRNIEAKYAVQKRWNPGNKEFDCAALKIETRRRAEVLNHLHSLSVERYFLLTLKKKYAAGQAIAIRLTKQITKITNKIKLSIEKSNATTDSLREHILGLPERLTFNDAKDPTSELYSDVDSAYGNLESSQNDIPIYVKRKAIDLHCFAKRCEEEEKLLELEMERLVFYYNDMNCKIDQQIVQLGDLSETNHMFSLGVRHELLLLRTRLGNKLFDVKKEFEIPPGDTVEVKAEFWSLSLTDVQSFIESEPSLNYDSEQSENEEDVEELSDVETDCE